MGPLVGKKILCREKDKKEKISDEEYFWINQNFKSKSRRVNLVTRKTLKNRNEKEDKVPLKRFIIVRNRLTWLRRLR